MAHKLKRRYLTNAVVCKIFGVTRQATHAWRNQKEDPLPYFRVKRSATVVYDPDALYEWLQRHAVLGELEGANIKELLLDELRDKGMKID